MEVLITGGNGLLGRHLVAALQDRGDSVRVLALPEEGTRWLRQRGVAGQPDSNSDAVAQRPLA
ncbi:MAG: NAD-dependent epimerase/dehydratase family protein [Streptosporangiaceae bacterium]